MTPGALAVQVLLWLAVITAIVCCVGIVLMNDVFERMHYMATVSTVSAFSILFAVVVQEGWGQATIKMILIALVLFLMNAVLTHATARAARVRQFGRWQPAQNEKIEGLDHGSGDKRQDKR